MNQISIEPVQAVEVAELARIGRQTFIDTFASGNSPDDMADYLDSAFSTDQLLREIGRPDTSFYFAKLDTEVIGYLKLNVGDAQTEKVEGRTLEIERIYVDARTQGAGIGRSLFAFALEQARQNGASAVWLGVWEDNAKAIEFYTRQGFVAFGEHEFTVGDDVQRDILMRLDLQRPVL
ncbi:GNAT family N-acetyltransferase [Qipengyuania sp. SM2507]